MTKNKTAGSTNGQQKSEAIVLSNNFIRAQFQSNDLVAKKIMNLLAKRYSDVLAFDKETLLDTERLDYKPLILDANDFGISKIRLKETAEKLSKEIFVRFPFIPPGGCSQSAYGPLFGATIDIKGSSKLLIKINATLIPYLRWAGQATNTNYIVGVTKIPASNFNNYDKSYSARIYELLEMLEQNYGNNPEGYFPTVSLQWFRTTLGLPEAYAKPAKLKQKVLDPAMEEIYNKRNILYQYDLLDEDGGLCFGYMRPVQIRFLRWYSEENFNYYSKKTGEMKLYMEKNNYSERDIKQMIYATRKKNVLAALYEEFKFIKKWNNPFAANERFKKDLYHVFEGKIDLSSSHE